MMAQQKIEQQKSCKEFQEYAGVKEHNLSCAIRRKGSSAMTND
jgi:hypothetical protein